MTQPRPIEGPTIIPPEEASTYLARMDIDAADLASAIEAGELAAENLTTHHPITAAGLTRWIHVVGRLREQLSSNGLWVGSDTHNRPISRHTRRNFTLSTIGGNEATGQADSSTGPKAARRKGRATADAANSGMIPLIKVETLRQGEPATVDTAPPSGNWFLLYHRAEGEIRREISLPLGFHDGQFTGWRVRVILDPWEPRDVTRRPLDVGGQDVDFRVDEVG